MIDYLTLRELIRARLLRVISL